MCPYYSVRTVPRSHPWRKLPDCAEEGVWLRGVGPDEIPFAEDRFDSGEGARGIDPIDRRDRGNSAALACRDIFLSRLRSILALVG